MNDVKGQYPRYIQYTWYGQRWRNDPKFSIKHVYSSTRCFQLARNPFSYPLSRSWSRTCIMQKDSILYSVHKRFGPRCRNDPKYVVKHVVLKWTLLTFFCILTYATKRVLTNWHEDIWLNLVPCDLNDDPGDIQHFLYWPIEDKRLFRWLWSKMRRV